ncbi:MAG: (2Fe-2S)-binding protein [Planctomycetota bacterium]
MSRPQDPRSGSADDSPPTEGVSRRGFLKGASIAVAAAGVVSPSAGAKTPGLVEEVKILGPGPAPLSLTVNGKQSTAKASPFTTLLDFLRNDLDITGAKRVCDRGACGACTVFMDGKTISACCTLAVDAAGHDITTVEGLVGEDGKLSDLQSAFVECDALQCGFCTPGMVMSCTALLAKNAKPTRDEVAQGIAGNICRCGTYENIFEAVALASTGQVKERKQ